MKFGTTWWRTSLFVAVGAVGIWFLFTESISEDPTRLEMASSTPSQGTLVYRQINDIKLDLDFYSPDAPALHPLVILIHDGCFTGGSKDSSLMHSMAEKLSSEGFAVAVPNYRKAPQYPYPAAVEDMKEVLTFLRRNANQLSINSDKVASFGLSAGGYLALRMAAEKMPIVAAISFFGRTDFTVPNNPQPNNDIDDCAEKFMGFARGPETLDAFEEASIQIDDTYPPVFLYHGEKDGAVPAFHSLNLVRALKNAKRPAEIFIDPHLAHMQFPPEAFERATDFLKRELKTSP